MISLDSSALRSLASHLDYLNRSAIETGVKSAADTADSVQMDGWPHSLNVELATVDAPTDDQPDRRIQVFRLLVGSPY